MTDTDKIFSWVELLTSLGIRETGTDAGNHVMEYVLLEFQKKALDVKTGTQNNHLCLYYINSRNVSMICHNVAKN